jgi:type IV pilus assembly protein PilO
MAKSFHELPPRSQMLVMVTLAALAAVGAWQTLLSPARAEITTLRASLTELDAEVMRARQIATRLPAAQREVRALEVALHETQAVLPDEKDPQDVLRSIYELARDSFLEVSSFKPKAVVTKAQYSEWPIELGLEGGYHDLGRFFDRIATMSRLMSVSDLQIRTQTRVNARGTVTAYCVATTFVFQKDLPAAVGGQP